MISPNILLTDATRAALPSANEKEVEKAISNVLHNAADRAGGRHKRRLLKCETVPEP